MVWLQYVAQLLSPAGKPLTVNLYQVLVTGLEMVYGEAVDHPDKVAPWVPTFVLVHPPDSSYRIHCWYWCRESPPPRHLLLSVGRVHGQLSLQGRLTGAAQRSRQSQAGRGGRTGDVDADALGRGRDPGSRLATLNMAVPEVVAEPP